MDRHQLLGLIAHRALELVVGCWPEEGWLSDYDSSWSTAAGEFEVDDWQRLPAAPLAYMSIRRWLLDNEASTFSAEAEVDLSSADGLVAGRADLVVRSTAGLGVVDLKTGWRAGQPLDGEVLRQLELYAALLEEGGEIVEWLGLLSATGAHDTVHHDRDRSASVLGDLRDAERAADVTTKPAGVPEPEACFGCGWLEGCGGGHRALAATSEPVLVLRIDQSPTGPSAIVELPDSSEVRRVDLIDRPANTHGNTMVLVHFEGHHRLVEGS